MAFKRFCDQLPREVDHVLLRPVVRKIKENIWYSRSGSMRAQKACDGDWVLLLSQPSLRQGCLMSSGLQDVMQAGNVHHFFLEDQRTLQKRKQLEDKARTR